MSTMRVASPANPLLGHVVGVIPARLESTRLPRKVLRELNGEPLLGWVYRAAEACLALDEVLIAADSAEVQQLCIERGWPSMLTSPSLPSGTDRLYAVSKHVQGDVFVNIQGDEPLLRPEHITAMLAPFSNPGVDVTTLKVRCSMENISNPNAVKVVTAEDGRALYFSRATIPYNRDADGSAQYWKHLGLYAYRRAALERFAALTPGLLEQTERLEQLRLLENGLSLYVAETPYDTVGVDTEEDLKRVDAILRETGGLSGRDQGVAKDRYGTTH